MASTRTDKAAKVVAVVEVLKGCGWSVARVSGNSHYVLSPAGNMARVSDHYVPETDERRWDRSQGRVAPWWVDYVLQSESAEHAAAAVMNEMAELEDDEADRV